LWWALRDNQEHREQRQLLTKAWAYPIFLLLMAFIVVLFLNHVLINQLSGFQMFGQTSPSTQLWFSLLKGMEWGYLGVLLGLICWVFMPKDLRMHWINGAGDVPIVRTWRSMSTYRLLTLFLKGLKRGLSLDDLIYALANSQTQIIRSLMKRVDENLENGISLAEAMQTIDPLLLAVFKLNDAERTVEVNLERYLKLQSLKINHNLQRIKWGLLSLAYLSFGIIILAAYQMMFEPIRLMEGLL
jgi:type II secretory pathway component PulF